MFQQYFQLPDSITPTYLTFLIPDKYLWSSAVAINSREEHSFCWEVFAQLVLYKIQSNFVLNLVCLVQQKSLWKTEQKIMNQLLIIFCKQDTNINTDCVLHVLWFSCAELSVIIILQSHKFWEGLKINGLKKHKPV